MMFGALDETSRWSDEEQLESSTFVHLNALDSLTEMNLN
jgi:hypothetical protein